MTIKTRELSFKNTKGFLFFTDYHAHIFTDFALPDEEFVTDRFRNQIKALEDMFTVCREKGYILLFGGDLFHKRGSIDIRVFNHVFKTFERNSDVPSILVRGNHDSVTNSLYTQSSLDCFSVLPNCIVVSQPEVLLLDGDVTRAFTCLPYGDEVDEMHAFLKEASEFVSSYDQSFLVAHIGVDGSQTGRYTHTLSGAFNTGELRGDIYTYVLLGHYHKRQFLGDALETSNILYGGNPIQQTFADEGQEKGYHLLDFSTGKLTFEPIPQKLFLTINTKDLDDEDLLNNNYIRLVADATDIEAVEKLRDEHNMSNVRVTVNRVFEQKARLGVSASDSPVEITKKYLESYDPSVIEKALGCISVALNEEN